MCNRVPSATPRDHARCDPLLRPAYVPACRSPIDPSQSYLQVSVYSQGTPLTLPQFTGSDIEPLSGFLNFTASGQNITFNSSPGSIKFGT